MDFTRLTLLYGVWLAAGLVLVGLFAMLFPGRHNRWFLPRTILGWFAAVIGFCVFGIGTLSFFIFAQFNFAGQAETVRGMERSHGEIAPALEFLRLDGRLASLDEYRGRVVVLNFWATWCPPCVDEMPVLESIQRAYVDRGLVIVHLSDEPPATIVVWIQEHPMDTDHGTFDSSVEPLAPFDAALRGRPVSFLIDATGVIRDSSLGQLTHERLEQMVVPYLEPRLAGSAASR